MLHLKRDVQIHFEMLLEAKLTGNLRMADTAAPDMAEITQGKTGNKPVTSTYRRVELRPHVD